MRYLFKFTKFIGRYRWRLILFLGITTVAVGAESLRPYWMKMMLDSAVDNKKDQVLLYLALFGVSTLGGNLISSLSRYVGDFVIIPLSRNIKESVFRKMMDLDFAFHADRSTGSLISAFKRGEGAVFDLYDNIFSELFRVLINLLVALYFLANASAELALILFGMFAANLFLAFWLIKINLKARTEFNKADDKVAAVITDTVINYETVKFFAAEERENKHLGREIDNWVDKIWKFSNSFRLMDITIGTTSGAGMLWILWLSINKLGRGFTPGDLVMVSGFLTGLYYQFFNLFFRLRSIAKNMVDLEKYLGILDNQVSVKDPEIPTYPQTVRGGIVFDHVSFNYPKDTTKTLSDINLEIKPGMRVAFAGRSGAGKTTLVRLLLRFYDPTQGRILLDGVDISKMKKTQLRLLTGLVPQEPIMFNNTLKFNLAYGKENASDEEIHEAARKANILEFVEGLPQKWETEVGERGIKLSGGQKQRLAIARALLSDPRVLIFDEATSNLDSESEKKIQEALNEVAKERTVIVIAHRFSTIRDADMIIVLSGGTIVETGTHTSLIHKKGIYQKLWQIQAKGKAT